jgi:hypothetical protein
LKGGGNMMDRFMKMLCGTFDNREQCRREEADGKQIHPKAKHIIGICNEKIVNLPRNFAGYFVIEESYFDLGTHKIDKHYLFLYEPVSDRQIRLSSYNIPEGLNKDTFTNSNDTISIDYNALEISPRFSPLILEEAEDTFVGENVSEFSQGHLFKFRLEVAEEALYVKEVLEKEGELVAGYYEPIIYKRVIKEKEAQR